METSYLFAYLADVQRLSVIDREACAAATAERTKPLRDKIQDWRAALPEPEQQREYTMAELVKQFKTTPGLIGTALHQLGWQRRRYWRKGSYGRYWVAGK